MISLLPSLILCPSLASVCSADGSLSFPYLNKSRVPPVNNNLNNRVNEGMTPQRVAQIAYNSLTSFESEALPGRHKNTVVVAPYVKDKYDGSVFI